MLYTYIHKINHIIHTYIPTSLDRIEGGWMNVAYINMIASTVVATMRAVSAVVVFATLALFAVICITPFTIS